MANFLSMPISTTAKSTAILKETGEAHGKHHYTKDSFDELLKTVFNIEKSKRSTNKLAYETL